MEAERVLHKTYTQRGSYIYPRTTSRSHPHPRLACAVALSLAAKRAALKCMVRFILKWLMLTSLSCLTSLHMCARLYRCIYLTICYLLMLECRDHGLLNVHQNLFRLPLDKI